VDVVFRGHRHDVLRFLLLHVVKAPEQIIQLLARRNPEQHFRGLVRLVEDAVGNAHAKADQIARRRLGVGARQHEVELAF